ncbi:MAG: radical SAM protein [Desulfuromonadales bacterium]|nr:radical SAM protein [Desulfuromonadales bacterium]
MAIIREKQRDCEEWDILIACVWITLGTIMDIVKILEEKGLSPPTRLTISITTNCNLRCEHCWLECEGVQGESLYAPADKVKRLITEFVDIGGKEICLTGGEPLTHPDFLEILSSCQMMNVQKIVVQTNATLLTGQIFRSLASLDPSKLNFQVSLDGGSPITHDQVRGKGSFDRAVSGIVQLANHGYGDRTVIGFTEMRHNLHEVPELLKFAAQTGVTSVVGWSLVQHGRAQTTENLLPPLPEQYIELLELYHTDQKFKDLYDQYGRFAAIEWFKGREQSGTCCRFIESPYVSAAGTLYPCNLLHEDAFAAFDLFNRSLVDAILNMAHSWAMLLAKTMARSKELECFKGCIGARHCAGGCFARTDGMKGCVEDRCQLRRAVYEWRPPC